MKRNIIISAAIFGLLAVVMGAFGAHALKKIVSADMLAVWQTGVQYQFYHTLALLFLSALSGINTANVPPLSTYCFSCCAKPSATDGKLLKITS